MQSRCVVAHRNNDRHVAMRRTAGGARMSHRRVEQRPGQLGAHRVADLQPAVGQHVLGCGRQPQYPGRRSTQQSRTLTQHPDPAVDLHSKPVRQPRLDHERRSLSAGSPPPAGTVVGEASHLSIPSAAGVQRRIRRRQSSTISASIRSTVGGGGGGRVAQHADLADRRDSPAAHRRQQLGQRRTVARAPAGRCGRPPAKYAAILKFRRARRGRRRRPRRRGTTRRRGPRAAVARRALPSAAMLPPWPLTKSRRCAQQVADLPYSTSSVARASVPMEIVPGKLWCSPLAPYAIAGAAIQVRSRSSARRAVTAPATAVAIRVSVSSGRCGPCCSVEPTGIASPTGMLCSWLDVEPPRSGWTTTR